MEIWKDIEGYEGYYQVSNFGRVKSLGRKCKTLSGFRTVPEKVLSNGVDTYGYPQINLYLDNVRTTWKVHRLVALSFIHNHEGKPTVNHKNGIKIDNRVENLEWATESENTTHAHKNGLARGRRGEEHGQTSLTTQQAIDIKYNHPDKTGIELSEIYGISTASVSKIRSGRSWKYI